MVPGTKTGRKFFVPQTPPSQAEAVYQDIRAQAVDQLRWDIADHRIFRLNYTHDKKRCSVEVGTLEAQSNRYTILAILDSSLYIVYARSVTGTSITILINKQEVDEVIDFI